MSSAVACSKEASMTRSLLVLLSVLSGSAALADGAKRLAPGPLTQSPDPILMQHSDRPYQMPANALDVKILGRRGIHAGFGSLEGVVVTGVNHGDTLRLLGRTAEGRRTGRAITMKASTARFTNSSH